MGYTALAARLTGDAVEAALAKHRAPKVTTCVVAVANGQVITTMVDDLALSQRYTALLDMGVDVDDPHGSVPWAIAFIDITGRLRVLGHGQRLQALIRQHFHVLSELSAGTYEVVTRTQR